MPCSYILLCEYRLYSEKKKPCDAVLASSIVNIKFFFIPRRIFYAVLYRTFGTMYKIDVSIFSSNPSYDIHKLYVLHGIYMVV
jgi:hypothetical protein